MLLIKMKSVICASNCVRLLNIHIRFCFPLVEKLLIRSLFLGHARSSLGLYGIELVDDEAIRGGELMGFVEILDGGILVLEANIGETAAVQGLGAIGVLDGADGEGGRGGARALGPVLELHVQQGAVVVEREPERLEGWFGGGGLVVQIWVLVEVAQALFVLCDAELEVAGLEGRVAEALAGGGDLEDLGGGQGLLLSGEVVGEVLKGVSGRVGLLEVGCEGFVAGELTAVGNESLLFRLVTGRGAQVFNLADDGFAAQDLAKDYVLVVEMGRGDGRDEELGAVCVYRLIPCQLFVFPSLHNFRTC